MVSWYKFEFAKRTPSTFLHLPSSGWRDDPYVIIAGEYSWMRRGLVVPPATSPASWGTSTRITGDKGIQENKVLKAVSALSDKA